MSEVKTKPAYTKQQYLAGESYKEQRDLIAALLEDDKSYTKAEVKKLIDQYMKKEVK